MAIGGLSFVDALQRMGQIRHDLDSVADPDEVTALEQEAATLADHCRTLLRRPRPLRTRPAAPLSTDDSPTGPRSSGGASGEAYDQETADAPVAPDAGNAQTTQITLPETGAGTVSRVTRAQAGTDQAGDDAPTTVATRPVSGAGADAATDAGTDPSTTLNEFAAPRTVVLPGDPPTTADQPSRPETSNEDAPTSTLPRQ